MDFPEFKQRFEATRARVVSETRSVIVEELPPVWLYSLQLWSNVRSEDLGWDESHFHGFDHFAGQPSHPHDEDWLLGTLWRDGFVPRWIDLSIRSVTTQHTIFSAFSTDVVTRYGLDGNPHYLERPQKPWGARSPALPPGWKNVQESGRFSLGWRKKQK